MGVCQAMALIGDARQAMSEGISGPVEIRLTEPVATAVASLVSSIIFAVIPQNVELATCKYVCTTHWNA